MAYLLQMTLSDTKRDKYDQKCVVNDLQIINNLREIEEIFDMDRKIFIRNAIHSYYNDFKKFVHNNPDKFSAQINILERLEESRKSKNKAIRASDL